MQVTDDQPKTIIDRKIIDIKGAWSLELVTFSTADGAAYGCRVFSELQSGVTLLFDNEEEPLKIAWTTMKDISSEVTVQELAGMLTRLPGSGLTS